LPNSTPFVSTNRKEDKKINILIGGKNGENVDTMIIAQIDLNDKIIKLISIPRDIIFNGRKINSAKYFHGMEEFKRELSVVTGLHINHYAIVDMYAFIDMINLLGGIDMYLPKPLIDPSYKTYDNGQWSTLEYKTGWHHFSGVQALRIARSRHTSSDFARAERQQLILRAIKKKIIKMNIKDIGKLSKMARNTLSMLETDLSVNELLAFNFRFRNFDIEPRGVLSTGNVLKFEISGTNEKDDQQTEKEKCYLKKSGMTRPVLIKCPATAAGQYILLPKRDWNTVRWYVKKLMK